MFKLEIINHKKTWNDFIIESDLDFYSFVDSWERWVFQEISGYKTFRYGIYEWKKLTWLFALIKVQAKRWTYFFTPHGPLIAWDYFKTMEAIVPELRTIAKQEWVSFIRVNSTVKNTKENKESYTSLGFIDAPMHVHAEDTHLLDITPSEDELLAKMHKKDRYYINRAIKEWVSLSMGSHQKSQAWLSKTI